MIIMNSNSYTFKYKTHIWMY